MTFKRFKAEVDKFDHTERLDNGDFSGVFACLLFAYYATEEGLITPNVNADFKKLSRYFWRRLPDLLEEAGKFHLVEKLDPDFCRDLGGLN